MGRKRKNPLPPTTRSASPSPSQAQPPSEIDEAPKPKRAKQATKLAKTSKAQKRPKRAIRQEIVLEVKDLRIQLAEEMERVNEQIARFGDSLNIAMRELDELRGVSGADRVVEVV